MSMLCGPTHLFKRRGDHNAPLSKWVGTWDLPFASPVFQELIMSICCCLFFRDYGSSKRKSGKRLFFLSFLGIQPNNVSQKLKSFLAGVPLLSVILWMFNG